MIIVGLGKDGEEGGRRQKSMKRLVMVGILWVRSMYYVCDNLLFSLYIFMLTIKYLYLYISL